MSQAPNDKAHLSQSATAYQCDSTNTYMGPVKCQSSPLEPGWFLVPAGATAVAPPAFDPATQRAVYDFLGGVWAVTSLPPTIAYATMGRPKIGQPFEMVPQTSGSPAGFAVDPALPDGVTLDTATGTIAGQFTKPLLPTVFLVTASNDGGPATAQVILAALD